MDTSQQPKKKISLRNKIFIGGGIFIVLIVLLSLLFPIDYYAEGLDYYNKQNYKKAYDYFSDVEPDDKNYNDAIAKIKEIKPLLDKQEEAEKQNEVRNTSDQQTVNKIEDSLKVQQNALEEKQTQEAALIKEKLKAKAKRDWPNDFVTQEFWINEQMDAYRYMNSIPDNAIKSKAQRDWPLDFMTQQFWYNEQIDAKERLNQ